MRPARQWSRPARGRQPLSFESPGPLKFVAAATAQARRRAASFKPEQWFHWQLKFLIDWDRRRRRRGVKMSAAASESVTPSHEPLHAWYRA